MAGSVSALGERTGQKIIGCHSAGACGLELDWIGLWNAKTHGSDQVSSTGPEYPQQLDRRQKHVTPPVSQTPGPGFPERGSFGSIGQPGSSRPGEVTAGRTHTPTPTDTPTYRQSAYRLAHLTRPANLFASQQGFPPPSLPLRQPTAPESSRVESRRRRPPRNNEP